MSANHTPNFNARRPVVSRDMEKGYAREHMHIRPLHNEGQNTRLKIETGAQWIVVTLNEVEVRPKFQNDWTSGTGGTEPVLSRHHGGRCS